MNKNEIEPVIVDAEYFCADCNRPLQFYLKRRKLPWNPETEKICFSCATGGVFSKPRKVANE